ncbi:MAG TPA: glycosyltransferase [Chloroflexi bacterium]|nr:glycosyltransferase [Chloroflexota bacterium]
MASSDGRRSQAARRRHDWRFWLGGAVSVGIVAWLVRELDWRQVGRALGDAQPGWMALALATVLLTIGARVLRWWGLLLPQRFCLGPLLTALLAGQVANYMIFSQLDVVVRAAALGPGNRARGMGAVALEKLWDVAVLLGLMGVLSVTLTLPDWLALPARLVALIGSAAWLLLLVVLLLKDRLPPALARQRFVSALLDSLEGGVRWHGLWWGLGSSLAVWGLGAATNYCVLRGFDLPLGSLLAVSLLLLASLQVGILLPSLPGSVGVFEGICIAVLSLFDVGQEQGLAVGLALHAVVFGPPLLLGGVLMALTGYRLAGSQPPAEQTPHPSFPPEEMGAPTSISVIVPVYNGAETLPACLGALQAQTYPADRYEVIVVDDGSTDATADVARGFGVQVISQPNAGPAAARNRGARAARGDVLLFTDADCAPTADWIARMAAPFADPTVAGVKGVYRTRQREWVARFVQAEYEDKYDRMRGLERIDFVDTYSAGYRRDLFLAAGGFDDSFPTASVEDQEFSFGLAEAGHKLVLAPQAQVFHLHDRTLGEYVRRKFGIGYWKVKAMREHPGKLVRDSHTPQVLKLQMGLAALGGVLLLGGVWDRRWAWSGVAAWLALAASGLPFILKLLRRDPPVALIAPLMLFVRAWALGLGFLVGLARLMGRR